MVTSLDAARIALVTHGLDAGGGVPAIARWLTDGLRKRGITVDIHDLATSRSDVASRRLVAPSTWLRGASSVQVRAEADQARGETYMRWGSALAEFEPSRYWPRRSLTRALNQYDLVQVVAGAPCWANTLADVDVPNVLQVATVMKWERASRYPEFTFWRRTSMRGLEGVLARLDDSGVEAVDHVVVENRVMESWVSARKSESQVSLVYPGIDTDRFSPQDAWSQGDAVVAIGRLGEPRKGWDRVIRAFDLFAAASGSSVRLHILGKGSFSDKDRAALRRARYASQIQVTTDASDEEIVAGLRAGSVFLQASYEEGLGLAGLEAMACGLPMVATDTAGTREYLRDGENGILIEEGPDVVADLAEGLRRVIVQGEGAAMSERARETVLDGFSDQRSLDAFIRIYDSLLGSSRPR